VTTKPPPKARLLSHTTSISTIPIIVIAKSKLRKANDPIKTNCFQKETGTSRSEIKRGMTLLTITCCQISMSNDVSK